MCLLLYAEPVGYQTVALSQTVTEKLPSKIAPPAAPVNAPKSLKLLTRLNLVLSDSTHNLRLSTLAQSYDLVALRPMNEKTLLNACTNLECDLISLDLSMRLPYHFKFKMLSAAISRGIRIEICYGPAVTGSGLDARRNLIGNAMALIRATRGRGIVISSEAKRALGIRAPWDVINLACVWGLSQERGKEAVCEEARKVVAMAQLKRNSWRGVIEVIDGGEQTKAAPTSHSSKTTAKAAADGTLEDGSDSLKRKASIGSDAKAEELAKPLSKREMKRRANKKARLEPRPAGPSANDAQTTADKSNKI